MLINRGKKPIVYIYCLYNDDLVNGGIDRDQATGHGGAEGRSLHSLRRRRKESESNRTPSSPQLVFSVPP